MTRISLILIAILYSLSAFSQSAERQQRNLEAFAKLYGYVQFFHPASDAPKDWSVLAVYGSKKMLSIKNDTELVSELSDIFSTIAPAVQIYSSVAAQQFDLKKITPSNLNSYHVVSWQHLGFGLPLYNNIYKSVKVTDVTKDKKSTDQLFKPRAKLGEYLKGDIVKGISCIVPYALYTRQEITYPSAAPLAIQELMQKMSNSLPKDSSGKISITANFPEIRLADVIIAWNVLKHSYPYWNDASLPAETILSNAIQKSLSDKNTEDFLKTLQLMTAQMNDGHMFVDYTAQKDKNNEATAPLILAEAQGKIVIKKINQQGISGVEVGDIVDSIDHQEIMQYLFSREKYLSGSPQWKRSKALVMALNGPKNTTLSLSITGKNGKSTLLAERNVAGLSYRNGSENEPVTKEGWLKPDTYYVNLSRDTITKKLIEEELCRARAIIFDLRGYPLNDEVFTLLPHFINKPLKKRKYFFTPQIIYPDFKNVSYQSDGEEANPEIPSIKAKIYFITDASAQSASETVLAQVKGLPNVKIIGTPSSGTNGNLNLIYLPGKYRVAYTGMVTKNADGSKHHLNGIIPDILFKPTIDGIKNGQDELLNLAIKIAKEQSL